MSVNEDEAPGGHGSDRSRGNMSHAAPDPGATAPASDGIGSPAPPAPVPPLEVSYEEVYVDTWTRCKRWESNGSVWVEGTCTRCAHRTVRRFGPIVVSRAVATARPSGTTRVVLCDCGRSHKDREPGMTGCGAMWEGSEDDGS